MTTSAMMTKIKIILTRPWVKRTFFISIIALCVLGTGLFWWYAQGYESTDDAYVGANVVDIAPRVTGQVQSLYIVNNQYVKQGQALFDLDPEPYIAAYNKAKAQLVMSQVETSDAYNTEQRKLELRKDGYVSAQETDDIVARYKSDLAQVQLNQAQLHQAELNLQYTHVVAPMSGWVTNVTLRIGAELPANQPVFSLVTDEEFWVDANFKETQFKHIKVGQKAKIVVDMYPNHPFHGVVESISHGSGEAFSLLPPQNATGNWVKVTQRVPVRIHVVDPDPHYPLRIGTTADVTIYIDPP